MADHAAAAGIRRVGRF